LPTGLVINRESVAQEAALACQIGRLLNLAALDRVVGVSLAEQHRLQILLHLLLIECGLKTWQLLTEQRAAEWVEIDACEMA
jgi:hypothetical protein